jgi:hypothetical protein
VDFLGLPEEFSFKNSKGGGAIINSISEGYFSSVNAAKCKKIKELNLAYDDPKRFKFVDQYLLGCLLPRFFPILEQKSTIYKGNRTSKNAAFTFRRSCAKLQNKLN